MFENLHNEIFTKRSPFLKDSESLYVQGESVSQFPCQVCPSSFVKCVPVPRSPRQTKYYHYL